MADRLKQRYIGASSTIQNCLNIKGFNIVSIETGVNDHVHVVAKITWLQTDTHTHTHKLTTITLC